MTLRHWTIAATALLCVAGCTLGKPSIPSLNGPSVLGLSLTMTASPDLMARGDVKESTITVMARDANSQPMRNLELRIDVRIGGVVADLGTLSSHTIWTLSDGRATVYYTAPPASLGSDEAVIQVVARPVGTDASNAVSGVVSIHLISPWIIQPPNSRMVARFFASPGSPHVQAAVSFDGSASTDADGVIRSYLWNFGDGRSASGTSPTVTHTYEQAAVYPVTLTITDDRGVSVTSAPLTLTVAAATSAAINPES